MELQRRLFFLIFFGKHQSCHFIPGQHMPATHSNPGCTSSSSSTWKWPSRRGQRSVLSFFFLCPAWDIYGYIGIYWDVLNCIGIYWDTVMVCECLWYFLMILIVSDGLWWLGMAGTCMIMYENVRYVMGGAQTVVGCTISTTFTWCDLHFFGFHTCPP